MRKLIFLLGFFAIFLSCNQDYYILSDPQEAILGKWKLIESELRNGEKRKEDSKDIYEYLSDNTFKVSSYDNVEEQYIARYTRIYSIDSLFIYYFEQDFTNNVDYEPMISKYFFYDDKLWRKCINCAIEDVDFAVVTQVYQRIK